MRPYVHEDESGRQITIGHGPHGNVMINIRDGDSASAEVGPAKVPAFALALYAGAGLPEPLILENLPAPAGLAENGGIYAGRLAGKVLVGRRDGQTEEFDPDAALLLAASIARRALAIKAGEPDPGAVADLAQVIEAEDYDLDYESRWGLARAILLGGYSKRETQA